MPPRFISVRYVPSLGVWQVWANPVVCFQHWHQGEVLRWLCHFGYEEVVPGGYERQVDFAA